MEVKQQVFLYKELNTLFKTDSEVTSMSFGTVSIPPGKRIPTTGLSSHEEDEYSIILKGELYGESGGMPFEVVANEATFIPAGEEHWAVNTSEETCEIVWMLVK